MTDTVFRGPGSFLTLTASELRILAMIAAGYSLARIARRAGISDHTVKYHLKKIFHKLGATGRAHAVAIAISHELLPSAAPAPQPPSKAPSLTPAQLRVLGLMASGYSINQMAERLGISKYTVKYHLKYAFWKLGAHERAQAVAIAARHGLLPHRAALSSPLSIRWIANTDTPEHRRPSAIGSVNGQRGEVASHVASGTVNAEARHGLSFSPDPSDAPASARL